MVIGDTERDLRMHHFYSLQNHTLGIALFFEARLAEIEERTNDAALIYMDQVRFGHALERGGDLNDFHISYQNKSDASDNLRRIADCLNAPTCRNIIHQLEELELRREPTSEILKRNKEIDRREKGFQFQEKVSRMLRTRSLDPYKAVRIELEMASNHQRRQALITMLTLARHAYTLEHGNKPDDASSLVPSYLSAIPQDPFTHKNLNFADRSSWGWHD